MKRISSAAVAAVTIGAVAIGTSGASASPVSVASATPGISTAAPSYAATAAFGLAAKDAGDTGLAEPTAVPAIVGTAFVAGAAAGAGKVVAGWAAKKVIGRWSVEPTLHASMLD